MLWFKDQTSTVGCRQSFLASTLPSYYDTYFSHTKNNIPLNTYCTTPSHTTHSFPTCNILLNLVVLKGHKSGTPPYPTNQFLTLRTPLQTFIPYTHHSPTSLVQPGICDLYIDYHDVYLKYRQAWTAQTFTPYTLHSPTTNHSIPTITHYPVVSHL